MCEWPVHSLSLSLSRMHARTEPLLLLEVAETAKCSGLVLLHSGVDADSSRCHKYKSFACKGGEASNFSQHLIKVHHTCRNAVYLLPS